MARRLVLIPVLPRLTVSEAVNFVERVCSASAFRMDLELSQAAPAAVAERTRNSRRRMGPPRKGRFVRGYTRGPCGGKPVGAAARLIFRWLRSNLRMSNFQAAERRGQQA